MEWNLKKSEYYSCVFTVIILDVMIWIEYDRGVLLALILLIQVNMLVIWMMVWKIKIKKKKGDYNARI